MRSGRLTRRPALSLNRIPFRWSATMLTETGADPVDAAASPGVAPTSFEISFGSSENLETGEVDGDTGQCGLDGLERDREALHPHSGPRRHADLKPVLRSTWMLAVPAGGPGFMPGPKDASHWFWAVMVTVADHGPALGAGKFSGAPGMTTTSMMGSVPAPGVRATTASRSGELGSVRTSASPRPALGARGASRGFGAACRCPALPRSRASSSAIGLPAGGATTESSRPSSSDWSTVGSHLGQQHAHVRFDVVPELAGDQCPQLDGGHGAPLSYTTADPRWPSASQRLSGLNPIERTSGVLGA